MKKRTYTCTKCNRAVGRDNLRVKRVSFREMGENGKTVRSRVEAWLCTEPADNGGPSCIEQDAAWTAKSHSGRFIGEAVEPDPPAKEDLEFAG